MHKLSSPRLGQPACVFIYFHDSRVDVFELLRIIIFLVFLLLFSQSIPVQRSHDLDMLVPFFRGSVSFGVIQANNNYRNVISGASFHGLFQQSLAASRDPLLALEPLVFESLHNLHNLNIIKSIPKSIRSHDDEIMGINFETGYLGFANYHFIVALFGAILGLEITKRASCGEPSRKHS